MGNTYNLAYHLSNSGGAELIKELVVGGTVYIGSSAGAIMAGRTIQMAFWKVRIRHLVTWSGRTPTGRAVAATSPQLASPMERGRRLSCSAPPKLHQGRVSCRLSQHGVCPLPKGQ